MHDPENIAALVSGSRRRRDWTDIVGKYEHTGAARVMRFWKEFVTKYLPPSEASAEVERPLQRPPSVDYICAYLSYRAATAQSRVGNRIAFSTMVKELQQFLRFVRYLADHRYSAEERINMGEHLKDLIHCKAISTRARKKATVLYVDVEEILTYMWCQDEYVYRHPRVMLQVTFWILLASFWGLRVGEVVESTVHRGSNEGLKYKDIEINLYRHEGKLRYQIIVDLRNRKFKRDLENELDYFELQEELDPEKKFTCPVRWFLSLAISDDVFVQHETLASFENRWIRTGVNSRRIQIKDTKKELPILRRLKGNTVSETEIMSAVSLNKYLKSLCERCGYSDSVSCYSFRRGFGNGIEGKTSSAKFKKAMAHQNKGVYHKSYISSNVSIDVQSILRGMPEDSQRLDLTRSVGFTRDFDLPKPHGSFLDHRNGQVPDKSIIEELRMKYPNYKRGEILRKARRIQFDDAKKHHLAHGDKLDIEVQESANAVAERATSEPSDQFRQMLKYNVQQAAIISTLWSNEPFSIEDCVQPLLSFGNPQEFRSWYPLPVAQPDLSLSCTVCGLDLSRFHNKRDAAMHVLRCYCEDKKLSFCFDCAQTSPITGRIYYGSLYARCRSCKFFNPKDSSYGILYWRDLLIKPGRCPFCKTKDKLWTGEWSWRQHVNKHLEALHEGPYHCPDQFCERNFQGNSMVDLKSHLTAIHGMALHKGVALEDQ